MRENADGPLQLVRVGKENLKGGAWVVRAQALVAAEGATGPMMAFCTSILQPLPQGASFAIPSSSAMG